MKVFGVLFRNAPAGSRRARFSGWWRAYAGSIAFLAIIVLGCIGFARIENARYDGCVDGNLLRQGLRETEALNIKTTEHTDLTKLFPGVPPDVLEELSTRSLARARYNINVRYADHSCGTRIDLPLTGAAIVFPP